MLVVSNTSPVSNLAIIGRLELLKEQLGNIAIPSAVHAEPGRMPIQTARDSIERAIHDQWIQVRPLTKAVPSDLLSALHLGEAEAISLALESNASLILLDETAARGKAKD